LLLGPIFENMCLLTEVGNLNRPPRVRVVEPLTVETPDATVAKAGDVNPILDPVQTNLQVLKDDYYKHRHQLERVEADFDGLREQYSKELHHFILEGKAKHRGRTNSVQLEVEFGPVWLARCQEMTKNMIEAEIALVAAEQAYGKASRAAKIAELEKEGNVAVQQIQQLVFEPDVTLEHFGQILPAHTRKHIDDWLDNDNEIRDGPSARVPKPNDVIAVDQSPNSTHALRSEGGVVEDHLTVVEGAMRRKIDSYNRSVRSQRPKINDGVRDPRLSDVWKELCNM
jgi:hypothetical protein